MSERLIIDNFAGLKHVEIELKKINVFIGPQATGKSVTAKLAYFFKSLLSEIRNTASVRIPAEDFPRKQQERFEKYFPPTAHSRSRFSVRYECAAQFAEVTSEQGFTQSEFYMTALTIAVEVMKRAEVKGGRQEVRGAFSSALALISLESGIERILSAQGLPAPLLFHQLFIPAERSFFAGVQQAVFSLLSAGAPLDPFLVQFGTDYEWVRHEYGRGEYWEDGSTPLSVSELHQMGEQILGAKYVQREGREYLEHADGRLVDIARCSSGQQAALTLSMLPAALLFGLDGIGQTFYVEEPEAHLFPMTQRLVVELMAGISNLQRDGFQFVTTTHSPYILTAFNNLMEAGKIAEELAGDTKALKKLHAIVPASRIISPKDVAAYYFDKGGAESIIDETGLIRADQIDSVSDDIDIEFDKLLDVRERQ